MTVLRTSVVVAGGLLLVACSGTAPKTKLTAASLTTLPAPSPDAVAAAYDIRPHVHVYPPAPIDVPTASRARAYAAWKNLQTPDYEAEAGHPADIHYGKVTDDDYGTRDQNGQDQLQIVNRLVWVLTFNWVPCSSSGGGAVTHTTVSYPTDSGFCTVTVLVDATSGATLLGFEDGIPAPGQVTGA